MRTSRQLLTSCLLLLLAMVCFIGQRVPAHAKERRLEVLPVIFVPSDGTAIISSGEIEAIKIKLMQHVVLAQQYYHSQLGTDTFKISDRKVVVFKSAKPSSRYLGEKLEPDSAHLMLKELMDWDGEDRYSSRTVYLTVFAQPANSAGSGLLWGGRAWGRPTNGWHNGGGGIVQMELSSLLTDNPYPFQPTLVHELGHAFGLTHTKCHGYDMHKSESIMGYNPSHRMIMGLTPAIGILAPEELFLLARNRLAFPAFAYIPAKHNPSMKKLTTIGKCSQGAMSESIGPFRKMPGVGYELLFNSKVVSGPEAALWLWEQARENCALVKEKPQPGVQVECRFDGRTIGYELIYNRKVVSGPETEFWSHEQARQNCALAKEKPQPGVQVECRFNGRTIGYELIYNDKVVSGPETEFWSHEQANENCAYNKRVRSGIRVDCRYDGQMFEPE